MGAEAVAEFRRYHGLNQDSSTPILSE